MRSTRLLRVAMAGVALFMATAWLPGAPAGALPTAPVITGYPDAAVGTPNAAFSFHAPDADGYQCRTFTTGTAEGSRPAYAACTGGSAGTHVVTGRADGAWTFEVRASDGDGPGPSSTRDWIVTSDPVVQWISEPMGTYTSRYVTATFTAAGATSFQCNLDGAAWTGCGSGAQGTWTSSALANGSHTLQVRATDGSGYGPVASAGFTVDVDLPVTWVSRPTGAYSSRYVTATFTAAGASQFRCRVYRTDPVPATLPGFAPCGSGRQGTWVSTTALASGADRLEVRGQDATTGTGATQGGDIAMTDFTVGVDLPVTWVSRPSGTYSSRYVTATFTAAGASQFRCRVYRTDPVPATLPGFAPCGSGREGTWVSTTALASGAHRLEVQGQDPTTGTGAGQGGVIASTDFSVDVPLDLEWIARPEGTLASRGVTATFAAEAATGFQCSLNSGTSWSACGTGRQGTWAGTYASGTRTLTVRAVDSRVSPTAYGDPVSTTFTNAPPSGSSLDVAVVSGPGEGSTISSSWAGFSFGAAGASCVRVELDGADALLDDVFCWTLGGNPLQASTAVFGSLPDGLHTLRLQAQSEGGAFGPVLTRTFTVESDPLTSLAVVSGPGEGSTISSSWAGFSFGAAGASCVRVELDGADALLDDVFCWTLGGNPLQASTAVFGSLPDGLHTLRLQAQSEGGAFGPVLTRTFTVESDPLTSLAVVSGPGEGSTISSSWAGFSFGAAGASCVRVELDGADALLDDVFCWTLGGNPLQASTAVFGSLPDGLHTLRLQAQSEGGAFGPVLTRTFTVESDPLTSLAVVSGPGEGSTISSSWAGFSFGAAGASCVRVELDGADALLDDVFCWTLGGNPLQASTAVFGSLPDGLHTLRLQAQSEGGAFGPVLTRTFTVRAGPIPHVSSHPRQVLPSGASAFAFHAPGSSCVRVELDGVDGLLDDVFCWTQAGNPLQASTATFTGLLDGPHTLRLQAQSAGGSFGPVVETTFVVETKAPETTIATGPPTWSATTAPTFTFTADEPSTFECRLDGAATFTTCPTPWTPTGLAQGPHSLEVRAVDGFGNVDATPDIWTWNVDTVAPTVIDLTGPTGVVTNPDATFTYDADEAPVGFECRVLPPDEEFEPCSSSFGIGPLADGAYRFEVRARDQAGNVSSPPAHREWTVLTDAPETEITSGPPAISSADSASISFTSPDSGVTFECSLDGAAYTACTSPRALSGLDDGIRTFLVRAVAAGVLADPTPASRTWLVDTTAPTVTITTAPTGTVGVGDSDFTFTTSEPATLTCALDGGAPVACDSPWDAGALAGGEHTLVVVATDVAGNISPPDSHTWTVDDVAPVVTITGGPTSPTNATSGSVTFTVDDPTADAECSLDGGAWAPCSSPVIRTGLGDGSHSVSVRATDLAGNTSAVDSTSWTVDTVPPVVTITSAPSGTVGTTAGSVSFTVTDPSGASAECSVDLGAWVPCSSPHAFTVVGQGLHSISVRATDGAGNLSPADSRTWTVDTVAPVVTITGGPTGTVGDDDAEITFTVDDPGPGVVVRCRLDGGAPQVCTSPVTYTGLPNGLRLVEVWATDAVGNVGPVDSRSWTIDTAEPETTITSAPPALTNQADAVVTFTSDIAGATFECRLDGGAWEACASGEPLNGLTDGDHRLEVRATANGLTDPTPAEAEWTLDTVVPVVTLTHVPPAQSREVDSHVDFTVDDPTATVECRVDGDAWTPCASPFDPSLADGSHTLDVRATDPAGNVGTAGPVSWVLDGSVPAVVITGGPANGAVITTRDTGFTFTVDDPTATVQCRLVPDAWGPCTGAGSHSLTGLADGPHSFQVRAVDAAGNEGATARSFTVDATAPTVVITSGPPPATSSTSASVSFTVDDPTAVVDCRVDGGTWAPCGGSPLGLTGLAEGPHSVEIRGTDPNGLVGLPVTRLWVVDLTPPTVTITAGPTGTVTTDDVTFEFLADEPATYECRVDDGSWDGCPSPHDVDDLPVGDHFFEVRATDLAGLVSPVASRTFTVELAGDPLLEVAVETLTWRLAPLASIGLGDDFHVRASVTNVGEAASEDTVVTVPLSGDLRTVRALPAGCTAVDADGPVTCGLGTLAAGATETIDIRVEAVFGCTRWGDSDDQTVLGTTGADVICGGGGADEIRGRGGLDSVYGYGPTGPVSTGVPSVTYGPGTNEATAPAAASIQVGGADEGDTITTGAQTDIVYGQGGGDVITTGGGQDTVDGGDGADQIDTGSGPSNVQGGAGDDTIVGGTSTDVVDGGPDADSIDGAAGADTLRGGDGNDTVRGGDGNDPVVEGGGGNDSVDAGTGNDPFVRGGDGADTVLGGSGTDDVRGGNGNDPLVDGGAGRDVVNGDGGADLVLGGTEVDRVYGGPGDDSVRGGDGYDEVVDGGDGRDQVFGDDGNDPFVYGGEGDDLWVDGGAGVDRVFGGVGDDVVLGGAGNDTVVNGEEGRDRVYGDDGNDPFVTGGTGADHLVDGGAGNDGVFGDVNGADSDAYHDVVQGGSGNDVVDGGWGDDVLGGGLGTDQVRGDRGSDQEDGGPDADVVEGGHGDDVIDGGDGHDQVTGGDGADVVRGGAGNDQLSGSEGADELYGGIGDDDLDGGAGVFADRLYGEDGQDILFGRAGDDDMLGGPGHDYMDGNDGNDYLNGQTGRDVLRGNAGNDVLDGGPAAYPQGRAPGDHWNRLYGDAGQDVCHYGPGTVESGQMTNYRDASCELRDVGVPQPGLGWLFGIRDRLDRGRLDPATYPG